MSEKQEKKPTFVELEGNVIDMFSESTGTSVFMHGANCQKVMGAGIAKQVRDRISPLFYLDQYDKRSAPQRYGSFDAVTLGQDEEGFIKLGVNLYTQFNPGPEFNEEALKNALNSFLVTVPKEGRDKITIFIPKIGCGIGGAKWVEVRKILKDKLSDFNVVVGFLKDPKENKKKQKD